MAGLHLLISTHAKEGKLIRDRRVFWLTGANTSKTQGFARFGRQKAEGKKSHNGSKVSLRRLNGGGLEAYNDRYKLKMTG